MTIDEAKALLTAADLFYPDDEDDSPEDRAKWQRMLNLNDALAWGTADCEEVLDSEMVEVARLFHQYGRCGVLYWVLERRGHPPEFRDVNRKVEFVRNEERIRKASASDSAYAYSNESYTIGLASGKAVGG